MPKKALYIRTSKTGSSTVAHWCKELQIPTTKNTVELEEKDNLEKLNYHFKEDHFLFYSIRNPYDRAVSCWHQCIASNWKDESFTFEKFLDLDFQDSVHEHMRTHLIPLTEYLGPWIDKVNYVIRLENFLSCMKRLSDELEIPYKDPEYHYRGGYDRSNNYLNSLNKKKIEKKYQADFEFFGY
jgi:hypothetical protein